MTTNKLEARVTELRADSNARKTRLAAIDPEQEALRQQLRRARGEAELGDGAAGKTVTTLERQLSALDAERDALEGALEILTERIADAEEALADARADQKEQVAAACRQAEEDAFAEVEAVLRRIVQPLHRMAAARHIASQHGITIADRAEVIRSGLAGAAVPGTPAEVATGAAGAAAFLPGHVVAVEALLRELHGQGVPFGKVALPELDPEVRRILDWTPGMRLAGEEPVEIHPEPGVIRMGRNSRVETDARGRPVEQSAQPPKGYRASRPAAPMAAFTGRR